MFERVEAFHRPASVREALQLLQSAKGSARIVAGCTDVIVGGDRSVRFLIDITHAGLSYIRNKGEKWSIGATTTMAELEESAGIQALAGGILARAAETCGSAQIRNVATVGGNMAHGSPAADLATPWLVLDAVAVVADAEARHRLPLAEYLAVARSRKTANSLLVEVTFPEPPGGSRCGWCFEKFGRTELDISIVNVAAGLELDARQRVKWARIALGAVGPAPLRMPEVEARMAGRQFDRGLIAEASEAVMHLVTPVSDQRASAEYRRELSRVLTGRALEACAAQAGCSL